MLCVSHGRLAKTAHCFDPNTTARIMAGRSNVADKIVTLQGVAGIEGMLEKSVEKCIVIDCYLNWCGPCNAIIPFYTQTWLEIDSKFILIKIPCYLFL